MNEQHSFYRALLEQEQLQEQQSDSASHQQQQQQQQQQQHQQQLNFPDMHSFLGLGSTGSNGGLSAAAVAALSANGMLTPQQVRRLSLQPQQQQLELNSNSSRNNNGRPQALVPGLIGTLSRGETSTSLIGATTSSLLGAAFGNIQERIRQQASQPTSTSSASQLWNAHLASLMEQQQRNNMLAQLAQQQQRQHEEEEALRQFQQQQRLQQLERRQEQRRHSLSMPSAAFDNLQQPSTASQAGGGGVHRKDDLKLAGESAKRYHAEQKRRFVLFMKVLMKCLEKDPNNLKGQVKAVVAECTRRNRLGDPNFMPLQAAIEARLRLLVGEAHWNRANQYVDNFMLNPNAKQELLQRVTQRKRVEGSTAA